MNMDLYWLAVTVGCLLLFAVLFAIGERYAIKRGKKTLSRWVYDINQAWPLFGFALGLFAGLLIGGLSVHFFWHWCPELGLGIG